MIVLCFMIGVDVVFGANVMLGVNVVLLFRVEFGDWCWSCTYC